MSNIAAALKPLIADLASSLFFAAILAITGDAYVATGIGIAVGIGQFLFDRLRGKPIATMQWMSLVLVIVFGTMTLYFHDARFVMVKFTIGHIAVGATMLPRNWMRRYLPKIVTDTLSERALTIYSRMWPAMLFGLAAANLYVGFEMSQAAWAWFLGVVSPASTWVLFAIQYTTMRFHVRYLLRRGRAQAAVA